MKIRSLALLWLVIIVTACTGQTAFPSASAVSVPGTSSAVTVTATQVLPSLTPSAETRPLPTVTFEKGPYLVPGSDPASISILWQSKDAAAYWVEAGTDSTYALGRVAPSSVTSDGLAKATVSNLQPGTHYLYRVTNGKSQAPGSFNTPSGSVDSLTFWVYGDSRSGQATLNTINGDILSSIQTTPADQTFVLFSGDIMDLANEGNLQADQFDPRYTSTRQMMSELQMINTMGNHDGTKIFIKYFPYPFAGKFYWSFDYGPAHVAVVDQYADTSPASAQWQWLEKDLSTSTQPWKFILLHEPGWSAGPHPNNEGVQKIIQNIAYHQHVAVIFAGHNHYYARAEVDGVVHITTGGGGAPLYDPLPGEPNVILAKKEFHYLKVQISGNQLTATAYMPDNQIIDQFTIQQ